MINSFIHSKTFTRNTHSANMHTFLLTNEIKRNSELSADIYPPIILDSTKTYVLGLIDLVAWNVIPNVDKTNNKFYIGNETITLPEGSYEISDIENHIRNGLKEIQDEAKEREYIANTLKSQTTNTISKMKEKDIQKKINLSMKANLNTMHFEIKSNKIIHFEKPNSIAPLLGFEKKKLPPNELHLSKSPVNISNITAICVDCNLITNSYRNNNQCHIIHVFYPNVGRGYRIIEKVSNIIYLPINTNYIDTINVKIVDQNGNLINFKKELIAVRLHLKEL